MQLTEEQIGKIRRACKLGKDWDVQQAVREAIEEANKHREWKKEVEEWLSAVDDEFYISECIKALPNVTIDGESAIRTTISRLKKDGMLEGVKGRVGCYRKKDDNLVEMNWKSADPIPLELALPLDLNKMLHIYKKNIILFAGSDDSGKTAATMDIIKQNQRHFEWEDNVHLFNAEMSEEEMNLRFTLHDGMSADDWNFKVYDRDANFGDAIHPSGLNIIDYLELAGDAHNKLGDYIREIFNALDDGVCVIMLHKKHGFNLGYGQELGLKIPRLYVTLENGVAKIIKCKNRKSEHSVRGWVIHYKLFSGWKFQTEGVWHDPQDEQDALGTKKYWGK